MDCTAIRPLISYYYDGEVTPEESALVEEHLAGCADCRHALAEYRMIGSDIRDLPMPVPPVGLHRDVWRAIEAQGAAPKRPAERPAASNGKIVDLSSARSKKRPALATVATVGGGWARALPAAILVAALGIMVAVIILIQGRTGGSDLAKLLTTSPYSNYAQQVQIQFAKSVLGNSVTNNTKVYMVQGAISNTVETTNSFNEQSRTLTIAPVPAWEAGAQYKVYIDASKVMLSGIGTPLDANPITFEFSTAMYTPTPTATSVPPTATDTPAPTNTPEPTLEPTQVAVNTPVVIGGDSTPQAEVTATSTTEPTATATTAPPTATTVPPTATNTPRPTNTAVPSTPTSAPTATEVPPSATDTPVPPKPSATNTLTPVPVSTYTPIPSTSTATTTATPTPSGPCSLMPVNGFGLIWEQNQRVRDRIGCPTADEFALLEGAQERFEGGYMFWRKDIKKIYVFYGNPNTDTVGVWAVYDDEWVDPGTPTDATTTTPTSTATSTALPGSDAEATALTKPPEGKFIPVRGFGQLWANNATVRARLGWAIEPEQAVTGAFQEYEHGYGLWTNNKIIRFMYQDSGGAENIWEKFTDTYIDPSATKTP